MIETYLWWIVAAVFPLMLVLFAFFWRLSGDEARMRKTFRVVPAEQTEWGQYFVVVNWQDQVVAGPTFYRRMVERCAALNAKAPSR